LARIRQAYAHIVPFAVPRPAPLRAGSHGYSRQRPPPISTIAPVV
jgi:hypothetical protein